MSNERDDEVLESLLRRIGVEERVDEDGAEETFDYVGDALREETISVTVRKQVRGRRHLRRVESLPVRTKLTPFRRRFKVLLLPRDPDTLAVEAKVDTERLVVVLDELVEVELDGESGEGLVADAAG